MNSKLSFLIYLFLLVYFSCNQNNYIIPCSLQNDAPEAKNGITVQEGQEFIKEFFEKVKQNTVGKRVPNIIVFNIEGQEFNLPDYLTETSLIYATNTHCGFGSEGIEKDFPLALKELKNDSLKFRDIILIVKTKFDYEHSESFDQKVKKWGSEYDNFFIVDEQESNRLNIISCPTKMVVNNRHIVTYYNSGLSTPNTLYEELKEKINESN